jgi:AraC family transcriptional regulator
MVPMLSISEQTYRPGLKQERHAHADTTVTMVLSGSLREQVGSVEEIARPLSIVVKPQDTEHANEFGTGGARTLQICIPAVDAAEFSNWQASLTRWGWQHAGPSVASFIKLLNAVRTTPADAAALHSCALEALATLSADTDRLRGVPDWLKTVREMIDDAKHPPRLAELAAIVPVHPVYLARRFRRSFGCSVSEYIQRRRIQRVAELTCDGRRSLSMAAHLAGFSDQAHMCRVFRSQIRMAPRQLRSALTA